MRVRNFFMTSVLCVNALSGQGQSSLGTAPANNILRERTIDRKAFYSKYYTGKLDNDYFSTATDEVLKKLGREVFSKKCAGPCGRFLPVSSNPQKTHFYIISSKHEKKIRWDKLCKRCKKNNRNSKESPVFPGEKIVAIPSNELSNKIKKKDVVACSELLKSDSADVRKLETVKKVSCIEFSKLEKCQEESLSNEAISNFNNFISLLREEYGKVTGERIYVKNKRSV